VFVGYKAPETPYSATWAGALARLIRKVHAYTLAVVTFWPSRNTFPQPGFSSVPVGLCRLRETAEATTNMTVLFCFKLASSVDSRLRRHLGRRGQLVTLIVLILHNVDLMTVPVFELGSDLEELIATTVKLPAALHADLKRIASLRGSSMNALMNSAIWSYTEEMSNKDGRRQL
jgi:hypothetical protein